VPEPSAVIWVDYVIVGIIGVSALLSLWRGFIQEALSLLTWLVALWVAIMFFEDLGIWLARWVSVPSARDVVAFIALFLSVLILGAVVNYLVSQLVSRTGLTATDRALGIVFGIARGVMIVAVLVLLAGLTAVPEDPWWQESLLIGHFQDLALWLRSFLPQEVAQNIQYP
jgi:membrane protein required for colicin V production